MKNPGKEEHENGWTDPGNTELLAQKHRLLGDAVKETKEKLKTVGYLDMETMNIVTTQMYIDGYRVKLVNDTSYGSLWEVFFTLKEF